MELGLGVGVGVGVGVGSVRVVLASKLLDKELLVGGVLSKDVDLLFEVFSELLV